MLRPGYCCRRGQRGGQGGGKPEGRPGGGGPGVRQAAIWPGPHPLAGQPLSRVGKSELPTARFETRVNDGHPGKVLLN
jgi:hypothetical protein